MSQEYEQLLQSFDQAIQNKEAEKFSQKDVDQIHQAAAKFFSDEVSLSQGQVNQIRDKWVKLADGYIDKGRATKKLQGTSRAEAIHSVLQSMLKGK